MKRSLFSILMLSVVTLCHSQQNKLLAFEHHDKTVYGMLQTPAGNGPFPLIIIVPGSGPHDRDGTVKFDHPNYSCLYPGLYGQTLRPYKQLAEALVDSGYAVLRYNKIEFTYGANLGTITFDKLWLPFKSAIDYAKTRAEVDTNSIILLGHSEGSVLIPFVASARNDIKALISVAGARTPFDSIYARQIIDITQQCGGDIVQTQAQANAILNYFSDVRAGNYTSATPDMFGVKAAVWAEYFAATDSLTTHYNKAALPSLFLGMGDDFNVPPSELLRLKSEITISNDFWSLPGLTHFMTTADDPQVSRVVPDTIVYWLRKKGMMTTGLPEGGREPAKIRVFPNPASETIHVQLPFVTGTAVLEVRNSLGLLVYSAIHRGQSILDLVTSDLPAGVYSLTVTDKKGNYTVRFLKR